MVPTSLTSIRTARKCVQQPALVLRGISHPTTPRSAILVDSFALPPPIRLSFLRLSHTSTSRSATVAFVSSNLSLEHLPRQTFRSRVTLCARSLTLLHVESTVSSESSSRSSFASDLRNCSERSAPNRARFHVFVARCFRRVCVYACVIRLAPPFTD